MKIVFFHVWLLDSITNKQNDNYETNYRTSDKKKQDELERAKLQRLRITNREPQHKPQQNQQKTATTITTCDNSNKNNTLKHEDKLVWDKEENITHHQ